MELHQLYGNTVSVVDPFYTSSQTTLPSISSSLLGSSKVDIESSPNSPFSLYFDCDTRTTLSDSQEQYSFTEDISGLAPRCKSLIGGNSYFHLSSPSVAYHQGASMLCSARNSFLSNASHSQSIEDTLQEIETALMGPEHEDVARSNASYGGNIRQQAQDHISGMWSVEQHGPHAVQSNHSLLTLGHLNQELVAENKYRTVDGVYMQVPGGPDSDLKQLLITCARALSENHMNDFDRLIGKARNAVSISGSPFERLGAYMVEGLVARKEASGTNIYRALRCREAESEDLLSYMHILYEICPYLKFGYMAANGAIAEACRNETRIHIIDFQIAQGSQWLTLLQALAARPGGPPHVRITGIDDPMSRYARGTGLEAVGRQLKAISAKFNIPVEFHGVPVFAPDVKREMLDIRPGEVLAVNFPLQLHHTPDESVDINNPRDGLLRLVKSLSPKVTTLVEQESNTNTTPFFTRFRETLDFYLAMFESIDVVLHRDSKERINVEQHCLARDIVNIIACEGKDRVERHELFGKWKSRLTMAGFRQYPLSSYVNSVIKSLLRCYSEHYTLVEKEGAMLLGWKGSHLISASAWL